ncbi:cold-shock DNA-binding domain protein [Nitzschia inconspicua]|uniref:Cold-shock DNA-binding domain protein n=1 Tax=Nitzschia inconspicua TaxID=303405 RepID=A0A9K3LRP6_9STRA|nr:cold-shock DNA-binding domain protein [Nitzschia inconspicua]
MSRNNNNNNNNNNGTSYNRSDSIRSSSSRRGSHHSRRPSNLNNLPAEQGIICSLKESFGFIHCADRPDEIFFHYSEVQKCHPDELRIDTEVEFKVSSSANDPDKLAAFAVHPLPTGTVVWETEEEPGRIYHGTVEKAVRNEGGRGGGSNNNNNNKSTDTDGFIRVNVPLEAKENDNDENGTSPAESAKSGFVVRLRNGEYTGDKAVDGNLDLSLSNTSHHSTNSGIPRLYRGDIVQFRILIDRRTKQKYAREIKLVQSEKERKALEKEKKMLESAVPEEGIIVTLNNGFGFIRSNKRREHVYFHYSNLIAPEQTTDVGNGSKVDEFPLKKGQEVKFLVVMDTDSTKGSNNGNNGNTKVSAREVEALPRGSVVFHTDIAQGVKGMVAMVPHPPCPSNRGDDSKEGKIRLLEPITGGGADDASTTTINEVLLHYSDAPGGVFTYQNHRNQEVSALWIYDGDILLFDVIQETMDGSYRAIPTFHTVELGGAIKEPVSDSDQGAKPVMRMLAPTLVGRAEGIVHTLKNDYGFIHFAERPIDVHFKMYDILPDELQEDIRRYMGVEGPVKLEPDACVQFDICAHGNITTSTVAPRGRGRGGASAAHERENIRGQRLLLLPPSYVVIDKVIASGIKAVVKTADPKQIYAGTIDLEEDVPKMSLEERHPLISKMLDSFLEESSYPNGRKSLVYRDTLSMKDDDLVVEMAMLKGEGLFQCTHIPIPGISPHPGRLCIRKVDENEPVDESIPAPPPPAIGTPGTPGTPGLKRKKVKELKSMRFDKSSLIEDLRDDVPPAPGDIVSCDIFQSRRNGNVLVRNMKIVERKTQDSVQTEIVATDGHGLGVIKDIVPKRSFGFISVMDDDAVRQELIFFHLPTDRRGRGLKKGDEVTFDFATEGGKRIAINVMKVPKGTVPSAASKNACFGYVLMEPSHTSLSDTPARKLQTTVSGEGLKAINSRWAGGKEDSKKANQCDMPEEGCILLLEDKSGMFQKKQKRLGRKKRSGSIDSSDSLEYTSDDGKSLSSVDNVSVNGDLSSDDGSSDDDAPSNRGAVDILSHLRYRNGSIAIHGAGANHSIDGSTQPKRGDLVSFIKGRKCNMVRDIRIECRHKATLQRGRLEDIKRIDTEDSKNKGTAKFIAATEQEEVYNIDLAEVISCDAKVLKEKESVEGILHDGKIFGVCRTCDLYLTSKLGMNHKERPRLNLTVKKDRGGKIIAQSMMAKGPDGTNGFKTGWTTRKSQYATGG